MNETFLGKSVKFKTIPVLRRIRWYLSFVIPMCEAAGMSGHTYTLDNYSNPRCACVPRVNNVYLEYTVRILQLLEMQISLKVCKRKHLTEPVVQYISYCASYCTVLYCTVL